MRIVITSQGKVRDWDDPEHYRFSYTVNNDMQHGPPNYISLQSARVLCSALADDSAFAQMVLAIATCKESDYASLVGQVFDDHGGI
jgi:hypothetical protein